MDLYTKEEWVHLVVSKKILDKSNKPVNYTTNDTYEVQKTTQQNPSQAHLLC